MPESGDMAIEVRDLSKAYTTPKGTVEAVRAATFDGH
jgi:hypothetical protein